MSVADDVRKEVKDILSTTFSERDVDEVPDTDDVKLGNDAVNIDATVLYADLAESTAMVNGYRPWFAAMVYKSFLLSACRMIRNCDGTITAFDGDRVMGVFVGGLKNSNAAKAALQINWSKKMINEEIKARYQTTGYDSMPIPRVKGTRREVRRMLAQRSKELLARYRRGIMGAGECPLVRALELEAKGE
jgi:hypothetical protein